MYIDLDGVKEQFPDIEEAIDKGTLSPGRVNRWIDSAENWVNGKIGQRYELPFSSSPPMLVSLTYEFFEFFWQKDIHTPTNTGDEVPWVYPRYDRMMKRLLDIAEGREPLLDASNAIIDPSDTMLDTMRSNHRDKNQIFSMKDSWEHEIDEDYSDEPD